LARSSGHGACEPRPKRFSGRCRRSRQNSPPEFRRHAVLGAL
jgi:hypothetical protein